MLTLEIRSYNGLDFPLRLRRNLAVPITIIVILYYTTILYHTNHMWFCCTFHVIYTIKNVQLTLGQNRIPIEFLPSPSFSCFPRFSARSQSRDRNEGFPLTNGGGGGSVDVYHALLLPLPLRVVRRRFARLLSASVVEETQSIFVLG